MLRIEPFPDICSPPTSLKYNLFVLVIRTLSVASANALFAPTPSCITLESVDVATNPAVLSSTCNNESKVFAIVVPAKVAILYLFS